MAAASGVHLVWVVRLSDGLIMCSSTEDMNQSAQDRQHKAKMKQIVTSLQRAPPGPAATVSVPLGPVYVQYMASDVALFLGLFDKSFAQTVAQSLLADVRKEFSQLYDARRVAAGSSAYFLMEFESFLEKSKKAYSQSASARALDKINGNLSEIQRVMSKSLNEVVSRGDDLDQLSSKSDTVLMESEQYRKASVDLNRAKWLQKYGVLLLIVVVIGGLLWVRVSYFSA